MWKIRAESQTPPVEMRKAFMTAVGDLMQQDSRIFMLEADLGNASASRDMLMKKYPDKYANVGICEANMVGIAAGMAMMGFVPFVHSFAPFLSRRAADQVYLEGAYARNSINLYASDPGVCAAHNGGTHSTYEDIAYMRSVPGVEVFHPADAVQMRWLVLEMPSRPGVHYIRANRKTCPDIYEEGSTFEIGKGNVLRQGDDVLILGMGDLLPEALETAELLTGQGFSCTVADMFSLKPFDSELVLREIKGKKVILTMENHSIYGGLGGIVAEVMAEAGCGIPLRRIGVPDCFGQVGDVQFLKSSYGLTAAQAVEAALKVLKT